MSEARTVQDDRALTWLVGVLVFVGVVAVYDTSLPRGALSEFVMQSLWALVGLAAYVVGRQVPSRVWYRLAPFLLAAALAGMLVAASGQAGKEVNGAQRWIQIVQVGSRSVTVQPAEIAKVALILFLARVLSAADLHGICADIRRRRYPLLALAATFAPALVAAELQKDLGTALIVLGIGVGMLFTAGLPLRRIALLVLTVAAVGAFFITREAYRMQRVTAFMDPFANIDSIGFQLAHSLMAIGTGGIWGTGLGLGRAKEFLPAADTDFVFTTVAEETGAVGSIIVIGLLALTTWRIFRIAHQAQAMYLMMLASGVGLMIGVQSLLNLYVVTGAVPTTGVPLPFISQGGSSLVTMLFSVGLVQRVALQPMIGRMKGDSDARASGGRWNRRTPVSRREYRRGVA